MSKTVIPSIDKEAWAHRLISLFPKPWTGHDAKQKSGAQHALFQAIGVELERTIDNVEYDLLASRIATALDSALDACAADYFSATEGFPSNIIRTPGEPDASFRARILAALLPTAVTREALINVLTRMTGTVPRVIEPWRFVDNAMLDGYTYFDVDTVENPGRLADPGLKWQGFIESPLPPYSGNLGNNPMYALDKGFCLDSPSGYLMDPDPTWWQQASQLDSLINKTKVFGTTVWRRYTQFPSTTRALGGTVICTAGDITRTVTVFPPFAAQYIILAAADWNTAVACKPLSNSQFQLTFSTPAPSTGSIVDWMAIPITIPQAQFLPIAPLATTFNVGIRPAFAGFTLIATPSWNTNISVNSLSSSIATLEFSTPAPEQASISVYMFPQNASGEQVISASATSITIIGSSQISGNYQAFVVPSWNTACDIVKGSNSFTVYFSEPPPAGGVLYWGVNRS